MIGELSLVADLLLALLVGAMIFYAVRLDRRLAQLRGQEDSLKALIASFDQAAGRADQSIQRLKAACQETETSLRATLAKAQALRDDLMFMVDRGDSIAERAERSRARPQPRREAPPKAEPVPAAAGAAARSESERELLRALRAGRGGG